MVRIPSVMASWHELNLFSVGAWEQGKDVYACHFNGPEKSGMEVPRYIHYYSLADAGRKGWYRWNQYLKQI